ncbi:amino acid/amide ABC transporter ATP-binding protein 1, HAAT family (TC 3.A.1.4.-) [Geodermatophilus africanus]|uniref:Amino acid/amide ABC transporter ATP-binding protein 1, HAAT family (TC 3.A.1.4.-) n=1 Tax=Geodermatophilus africanus TaxID=1137993 RepID=A0A1H3EYY2_9ACTN|nr:ABC transporter ATP-binding protein [Geodermatophilus africanus]SDX83820.1 amino acid/amide ABC transporter ATP-binding protein 1, HAAT family (TC 3.A.1.4.-) [Geodermatophilus africanus]
MSRSAGDLVLEAQGLDRSFGGIHAVDDVSLEVPEGSLHAIIGPNGSGKTTLFNLITGHTRPTSGRVRFAGEDITGMPYSKVARKGLAKSYQITTVFPLLTVFENVRIAAQAAGHAYVFWRPADGIRAVTRRTEEVLERIGLAADRDVVASNLSHGDQRRLDLAIALATSPRLLLLDEPTAGMSPPETAATVELVQELNRDVTILMIEHKMDVILTIADRITVLHQGRKLFEGTPDEVRDHPEVKEVYLTGSR